MLSVQRRERDQQQSGNALASPIAPSHESVIAVLPCVCGCPLPFSPPPPAVKQQQQCLASAPPPLAITAAAYRLTCSFRFHSSRWRLLRSNSSCCRAISVANSSSRYSICLSLSRFNSSKAAFFASASRNSRCRASRSAASKALFMRSASMAAAVSCDFCCFARIFANSSSLLRFLSASSASWRLHERRRKPPHRKAANGRNG